MPRRAIAFVLILVGSVVAVPPAHADHDTATATIQATVGPRVKDGVRRYTITITTACSDPGATVDWVISRQLTPKNRKAKPAFVGHVQRSRVQPGTTTIKQYVAPGTRWVPAVHVTCRGAADDHHDAEVDASGSRELYVPPHIDGWHFAFSERCGTLNADRKFQVGMPSDLALDATYDWFPMLRRRKGGPVLHVAGGGLDLRLNTRGSLGRIHLPKMFRRPGTARVWLDFDGERSNVVKIPIVGLPVGCG